MVSSDYFISFVRSYSLIMTWKILNTSERLILWGFFFVFWRLMSSQKSELSEAGCYPSSQYGLHSGREAVTTTTKRCDSKPKENHYQTSLLTPLFLLIMHIPLPINSPHPSVPHPPLTHPPDFLPLPIRVKRTNPVWVKLTWVEKWLQHHALEPQKKELATMSTNCYKKLQQTPK